MHHPLALPNQPLCAPPLAPLRVVDGDPRQGRFLAVVRNEDNGAVLEARLEVAGRPEAALAYASAVRAGLSVAELEPGAHLDIERITRRHAAEAGAKASPDASLWHQLAVRDLTLPAEVRDRALAEVFGVARELLGGRGLRSADLLGLDLAGAVDAVLQAAPPKPPTAAPGEEIALRIRVTVNLADPGKGDDGRSFAYQLVLDPPLDAGGCHYYELGGRLDVSCSVSDVVANYRTVAADQGARQVPNYYNTLYVCTGGWCYYAVYINGVLVFG
ncbi:MAG: hypothetical protein ACKVWR_19755 [Acidimicrobiales bacterium]